MQHAIEKLSGVAAEHHGPVRLLPWSGSDGKPCYLVGEGGGYVSRVADEIEAVQLGMADDILGHAEDMLAGRQVTTRELRFLARGLADALRDVRRIVESRGARPSAPGA
ncbi:hypothetical protein [Streptomyces decoyicus]|uniref:hypothetical protein n=1 Tax=Streptomyces decoyicus TaxID=249567 RepID=UPI0033BA72EB